MVLEYLDLPRMLAGVYLVITTEGSMDLQTLGGEGPMGIARRASEYSVPTIAVVGSLREGQEQLYEAGLKAIFPIVAGPIVFKRP
jgi:glycerate 2-kinase